METLFLSVALLGTGAEPAPQFTVVNKCPPTFTVTNRMPAKPVASQGCGCTASSNCGASFCKARGGKSGCGDACPVKAVVAEPVQAAFPYQTYQSPSCANGQCSSGRTGWYPGKLLGR